MHKVFNDCVHGHITLHPLCISIINTPEFHRLKDIKQLSIADYVYPGACNNRFEHSLGVCYLAGEMVEALKKNEEILWKRPLNVSREEKLMVEIAGLCHDLGHGPFSHTWEHVVTEWDPQSKWSHEDMSGKMIKNLIRANKLEEKFQCYGLYAKDIDMIIGFIKGEAGGLPPDKLFLSEIVSNSESGVDVDKWDYLLRDSLHLNIHFTFDYKRLMRTCTVVKVDTGHGIEHRIGYRDNTLFDLYEMYNCRSALHYKMAQHKVVKSVELMLRDAFKESGEHYKLQVSANRQVLLKDTHKDEHVDLYERLTDKIQHGIQYSNNGELEDARAILTDITKRNLYKYLGRKRKMVEPDNLEAEKEVLLKKYRKDVGHSYKCGELAITKVKIEVGKKSESDPVSKVIFYRKPKENDTNPVRATWEQIKNNLDAFPFKLSKDHSVDIFVFCKCDRGEACSGEHNEFKTICELKN